MKTGFSNLWLEAISTMDRIVVPMDASVETDRVNDSITVHLHGRHVHLSRAELLEAPLLSDLNARIWDELGMAPRCTA